MVDSPEHGLTNCSVPECAHGYARRCGPRYNRYTVVTETLESVIQRSSAAPIKARPGLVLVWTPQGPACHAFPVEGEVVLGRENSALPLDDPRVSRIHCKITFDGAQWAVQDCSSRNGTFVAGARVQGTLRGEELRPIRVGHCLFLPTIDVERSSGKVEVHGEAVVGGGLRDAWRTIAQVAAAGEHLLLSGPSGAGKQLAARHFHASGPRPGGPFVPVQCAGLPEGGAEAALFGEGGAVAAATGGTLFLAGIGELEAGAQAALLRVLEARSDLRCCFSTRHDLQALVQQHRLREDLFFRVSTAKVDLPPLQQRLEEVAFHVHRTLASLQPPLVAQVGLVERCLARAWPGNVRELLAEVRAAARSAQRAGRETVEADDLSVAAGLSSAPPAGPQPIISAEKLADASHVEAALRAERGSVRAAARRLGVHRNQLRRWLDKHKVDPRRFGGEDSTESH